MKIENDNPKGGNGDLREENERLKKKLTEEYGMLGYMSNISPELENAWLKSIEDFEKNYKKEKDRLRNDLPMN
jgi:hypothetical protein